MVLYYPLLNRTTLGYFYALYANEHIFTKQMVKEELGTKEKQLDRLEEQAAQASLSMSRQLEMATRDEDRVKALYESEKLSLVARQREVCGTSRSLE